MEMFDATVLLTALPALGETFGRSANAVGISVTLYAVAVAAIIPISGWAADRFGGRRVFVVAILAFVLASAACAAASTLEMFVAARLVQGAAAALMSPVARLMVLARIDRRQTVEAIAILTWPALIAPLAGPVLGGWLVEQVSWRWIFLINIPLGLTGMLLAMRLFGHDHWLARKRPLDAAGLVLTCGALGMLVTGLDRMGRTGDLTAISLFGLGVLTALAALWRLRHAAFPLVDLSPLAAITFRVGTLTAGGLARAAINATPYLLILQFQTGWGLGPAAAGTLLMIYMAGNLAMKPLTTSLLRRFRYRDLLVVNAAVSAVLIGALAFADGTLSPPVLYLLLFAAGLSRSLNFTGTNTLTFVDMEPAHRGAATTLASVLSQLAFSLGIAGAALGLDLSMTARGAALLAPIDFQHVMLGVAAVMAASAVAYRLELDRSAGTTLSPPPRSKASADAPDNPSAR
nr:MFS transporter [Brevundimonas subvibrioides]